jgi:hypothetical protein
VLEQKWSVLLTFQRNVLPLSSGLKLGQLGRSWFRLYWESKWIRLREFANEGLGLVGGRAGVWNRCERIRKSAGGADFLSTAPEMLTSIGPDSDLSLLFIP